MTAAAVYRNTRAADAPPLQTGRSPMTTLCIEWTGRRHADDADEEAGIAAAECALSRGATWPEAETACASAMTAGWADTSVDNWSLTTRELTAAAPLMDDELREAIHDEVGAEDPRWYLAEYERRHAATFDAPFVVN